MSAMDWIRKTYDVPAKRSARVIYTGDPKRGPQIGTVTSASCGYLRIRLDGERSARLYHPTWSLKFIQEQS